MEPIWKDYIVSLGAGYLQTGKEFSIVKLTGGNTTIFSGKAYPKTSSGEVLVRINDICAEYLKTDLFGDDLFSSIFQVRDGGGNVVDTVTFYNDWSFDNHFLLSRDGLSFPIVRTFAWGQLLLYSTTGSAPVATITNLDGTQESVTLSGYDRKDDFLHGDFNEDFAKSSLLYGGAWALNLLDYPGAVAVEIGGQRWVRSQACPRYVVYYRNAYGGWDALPIEGKHEKADAVTRHTREQVYNNGTSRNRGKSNFVNELRRTLQLHTGWLTLEQSERMHHLLNSVDPFVHDLQTGEIYAATLTGSTTEYKEGRGKMYAYRIDAELAQERIRR